MNYKAKVEPNNFSSPDMELTNLEEKHYFQKVHPLKKSELWAWVSSRQLACYLLMK